MSKFYEIEPTLENYWRSIILFGRNVASYKFALAKSLYDLKDSGESVITLDKLAFPFSKHYSGPHCPDKKESDLRWNKIKLQRISRCTFIFNRRYFFAKSINDFGTTTDT